MPLPVKPRDKILVSASRPIPFLVIALAGLSLVPAVPSQQPVPPVPDQADIVNLMPLGYISRQVRLPLLAKEGNISSVLTAETLLRVDERHLQAGTARVIIFGSGGAGDLTVKMPSAVYDVRERTVRSGERCLVSRPDFEMEGDSLVFDTAASIGQFKGRVRTVIHDLRSLGKAPSPTAPPAPSPPPSAR